MLQNLPDFKANSNAEVYYSQRVALMGLVFRCARLGIANVGARAWAILPVPLDISAAVVDDP